MADSFQRHIAKYSNDVKRCLGALVGISQGVVCDGNLNDREIHFLNEWLIANDEICVGWPGDIIHQRIKVCCQTALSLRPSARTWSTLSKSLSVGRPKP